MAKPAIRTIVANIKFMLPVSDSKFDSVLIMHRLCRREYSLFCFVNMQLLKPLLETLMKELSLPADLLPGRDSAKALITEAMADPVFDVVSSSVALPESQFSLGRTTLLISLSILVATTTTTTTTTTPTTTTTSTRTRAGVGSLASAASIF